MDLELTEEQADFRSTIERFLEKEVPMSTVREWADTGSGFDRQWWRRAAELGVVAPLVPEECGGGSVSGAGVLDLVLIAEEFGKHVSPGPLAAINTVLAALVLAEESTSRHAELIESLTRGGCLAAWAVCEPDRGWEPAAPGAAVRTTASGYVLTGTKDRVEHGAQADVLLVSARDDSGVSLFLIPADRAGVTVTPMTALDMCRRYAQVRFESVALTEADLVGVFGAAAAILEYQALISGLMQTAETVGVLTSVFDMTVAWAFDRYTFGRPLASYQALKHRFADMRTWIEASAAIASTAAHAVQDGEAAAALTVCAAQSFVGDIAPRIIQDCVQLHGGIGMTWEHDLHLYLRRAVVNRALHGTPEEHRRIIADLIEL